MENFIVFNYFSALQWRKNVTMIYSNNENIYLEENKGSVILQMSVNWTNWQNTD